MKTVLIFLCCLTGYSVNAQSFAQKKKARDTWTEVILQKQFSKSLKRSTSTAKERLVGASIYADSLLTDSLDYWYSNGRGSTVDVDNAWLYEYVMEWRPVIYLAPPVLLFYDSVHRYTWGYSSDTAHALITTSETAYRSYDLSGRLTRDSLLSSIYCNRFTDLEYDTNGNVIKYTYHYLKGCLGDTTSEDSSTRIISYTANGLRWKDSISQGYPVRVLESKYDPAGRLISITTLDATTNTTHVLKNFERSFYSYDTLGRLSTVLSENDYSGTGWGAPLKDSFGYAGDNSLYNYSAHYEDFEVRGVLDSLPSNYLTYIFNSEGKWDSSIACVRVHFDTVWHRTGTSKTQYTSLGNVLSTTYYNKIDTPYHIYRWKMHYEPYSDSVAIKPPSLNKPIIYPNPANSILNIEFDNPQNEQVVIKTFDVQGRLCQSLMFPATEHAIVPVRSLSDGAYLIKLWVGNEPMGVFKFIKTP
jgi:hypothetical protein